MKRSTTGIVRPWDKKQRARGRRGNDGGTSRVPSDGVSTSLSSSSMSMSSTTTEENNIPYVTIDGTRFYSDRFYLHRIGSVNNSQPDTEISSSSLSTSSSSSTPSPFHCTCGVKQPLPLLDRHRLVQSLDLQCAVLASYTLDKAWLTATFPTLAGPNASTIPTLVLHGKMDPRETTKKHDDDDDTDSTASSCFAEESDPENCCWVSHQRGTAAAQDTTKSTMDENDNDDENDDDDDVDNDDNDDLSIGTQPDDTIQQAASVPWSRPPVATAQSQQQSTLLSSPPPPTHLQFTQIAPTWTPPANLVDLARGKRCHQRRQRKPGVYHPKYMLLLERSGSLVVVVSTANLTGGGGGGTTEASWIQRFPPKNADSTAANSTTTHDFGNTLHDFLVQQSRAAVSTPNQLTPLQFWKRYAVQSLRTGWDYSQAQVELIPHVPGDYSIDTVDDPNTTSTASKCYGRQKVRRILTQRAMTMPRLSAEDRLILQPTSLGADWTVDSLAQVARSYLPFARKLDNQEPLDMVKRLDILWPTDEWVQEIRRKRRMSGKIRGSSHSVNDNLSTLEEAPAEVEFSRPKNDGGPLFLSSDAFNRIHTDCLARMVQWEPTPQHPPQSLPHIKSIARLLHHRPPGVAEGFAWFLLTSACLSQGAQGIEYRKTDAYGKEHCMVSYRNFELGVLFCSQRALPMSPQPSRIYCYQPSRCTCETGSLQRHRLIHLPLPYQCRPVPYAEDPFGYNNNDADSLRETAEHDDQVDHQILHFAATPYFHEIPPGTAAVSNMLLTPYGKAALSQQKH